MKIFFWEYDSEANGSEAALLQATQAQYKVTMWYGNGNRCTVMAITNIHSSIKFYIYIYIVV